MVGGAPLPATDWRRTTRHPVDYRVIGEHRQRGDVMLHIVNLSPNGFMVEGACELGKGERVTIRLPGVKRIEAFLVWNQGERAGFQFERILPVDDLRNAVNALQAKPQSPNGH
jgi:hypothetical protein